MAFQVERDTDERHPAVERTVETGASGGPWASAWRRLRRDKGAWIFGALFVALVLACLAAPLWASYVAHTTPDENHIVDTITLDGQAVDVVSLAGVPIGPTWRGRFFLGADENGRDIMVRLLYGGRNSLLIGIAASMITTLLAVLVGLLAGYFRGWTDGFLSRLMDIMWAFPVILLGIALGTSLAVGGLDLGRLTFGLVPIAISGSSLAIPILVIAIVYVPYLARPLRGEVLALREKEFIEAARAHGMGTVRILAGEMLPNVASTVLVFFPLLVANAILLEAALSFLGAGVQPPSPSWGTMISDGVTRIVTAPHLAIAPGVMLVVTIFSLNALGDAVRDVLDPRSTVPIGR